MYLLHGNSRPESECLQKTQLSGRGFEVFNLHLYLIAIEIESKPSRGRDRWMGTVCVVLRVFFPFILDVKFVGCIPAGVTQEEGHTGFFIHLPSAVHACIFLAREGFSHSFPSASTVKSIFLCTNDFLIVLCCTHVMLGFLFLFL